MKHFQQRSKTRPATAAIRRGRAALLGIACWAIVTVTMFSACARIPSAHTASRDYGYHQTPTDAPVCVDGRPAYDDFASGGHLFKLHCGSCHNARALGERPFNQTEVAFAHMRRHAYLTGKEYRQLIHFLRRWHDLGPPTPDVEPTPQRVIFPPSMAGL